MEGERLMLHATLLPSAPDRALSDPCGWLLRPLGHIFPRFRVATASPVYVPPLAFDWLTKLEAKETPLRARKDQLVPSIRSHISFVRTGAYIPILYTVMGYNVAYTWRSSHLSGGGWVVLIDCILMLLHHICLFGISHNRYMFFSRDISGFLREGDTLLDQTVSIRDYVRRTPISSVALSSPMEDIVRFEARIETLIARFRDDVGSVRRHRMWHIIVLVGVCVMGFMLGIVGPWWVYVHAEELFGH